MKYYTHKKTILDFNIPFDGTSCDFVSKQVYDFDHTRIFDEISFPVIRIEGESDSFYTDKNFLRESTYVIKILDTFHLSKVIMNSWKL